MRLIASSYVTIPQRGAHLLTAAGKMVGLIFFTFLAVIIICSGMAAATPARTYDSLDTAVRGMTTRLLQKARVDLGEARRDIRRVIAVDLFVDSGTGEVPLAGLEIERIVGHASRTGSESWNALLSQQRAKFIQKKLKIMLPGVMIRSEAIGVGSGKNLVGIGTDDNRDAPDRRVEIVIIDCKKLQTR